MSIDNFADTTPAFLPETFFDGQIEGWGVLETLTGALQRRYVVKAEGRWDASIQTVNFTETWTFDNGHVDTLSWQIKKLKRGSYEGRETRIDGTAAGEQAGCAFHWSYSRDTPQADGSSTKLNFDDWFYMIDERTAVVRGTAGRVGLPFGTAHVTYHKIG